MICKLSWIIAVCMIFFLAGNVHAQEDSLPSVMVADTVIQPASLPGTSDSLSQFRRSKEFAYINYLDSLLKVSGTIKSDTFSNAYSSPGKGSRKGNSKDELRETSRGDNSFVNSLLVRILFWLIAIGFICFILYRLFLGEGYFRKNTSIKSSSQNNEDELLADPSGYDGLITEAIRSGNYRLAVRYLYIQTLQKLSHAGVINFSPDKTNYTYVRELNSRPYHKDFISITMNYEYIWYGNFTINENQFNRMKNDINLFHQKI